MDWDTSICRYDVEVRPEWISMRSGFRSSTGNLYGILFLVKKGCETVPMYKLWNKLYRMHCWIWISYIMSVLRNTLDFLLAPMFKHALSEKKRYFLSIWIVHLKKAETSWKQRIQRNFLYCNIIVSEFELQSYYYVHFLSNTLGKAWTLL